jgi:hypothetical protein
MRSSFSANCPTRKLPRGPAGPSTQSAGDVNASETRPTTAQSREQAVENNHAGSAGAASKDLVAWTNSGHTCRALCRILEARGLVVFLSSER